MLMRLRCYVFFENYEIYFFCAIFYVSKRNFGVRFSVNVTLASQGGDSKNTIEASNVTIFDVFFLPRYISLFINRIISYKPVCGRTLIALFKSRG